MADDMFSDGDYEATETVSSSEDTATDESESQTALLPISLCPGMEPGDVIKVRIVEVMEQDYMIEYLDADEEDEEVAITETVTSSDDEMFA